MPHSDYFNTCDGCLDAPPVHHDRRRAISPSPSLYYVEKTGPGGGPADSMIRPGDPRCSTGHEEIQYMQKGFFVPGCDLSCGLGAVRNWGGTVVRSNEGGEAWEMDGMGMGSLGYCTVGEG